VWWVAEVRVGAFPTPTCESFWVAQRFSAAFKKQPNSTALAAEEHHPKPIPAYQAF